MSDKRVFHGREATVRVGDTIAEVDPDAELTSQLDSDTDYSGEVMDIDIGDPEASIEVENTFGGQFKVETPPDLVEIDVTMRFKDLEVFEEMHGNAEPVGDTEFERVSGSQSPGSYNQRAFLFELEKDGDIIRYLVNDARFQQMGEVSLDAEGFAEISGTVVALIEDRYIEQNF